jgi:hypothetical protein
VKSYVLGLSISVVKRVAAQCAQQGVTAKPIISNSVDSTFAGDPLFDGLQVADTAFPFFDQSVSATKAFHDTLTKYAPSLGAMYQTR